ncbi:hypothetical protein MTO96_012299 [Rhipicephalus appendiculatus]
MDQMTGRYVERRYLMLDVRTSYTYPAADLVTLSKLLRVLMAFPIDLLLLRTHLPEQGTEPCEVLGPTTSVRAAALDSMDVPIMVCYDLPSPVTTDGIEMAWFLKSNRRKPSQVVTFEVNSTIWPKMKHVYKLYTGKHLGWAVDDVEYDISARDCRNIAPLVQLVGQGRPGRITQLP